MPVPSELPDYDQLPSAPEGGRSAWGIFGEDDNVGLFNLLTPERVRHAVSLVKRGACFPLDAPIDGFAPALFASRGVPRRTVVHAPGALSFDDVYDNFFPQASSQWDSLGHVGYGPGVFYNGATEDDVAHGRRNGIEHWARRGIAGRAVLLDMVRTFEAAGRDYHPGTRIAFSVEDLEAARRRSAVELAAGDILIIHTGFSAWYRGLPAGERAEAARAGAMPGIDQGEEMCRYLWNAHVSAVVSDSGAVEAFPVDRSGGPTEFLHRVLIAQFGMALGELWWTEDLAADCAGDGIYQMLLTSTPIHAPGGVGSPANALAIK
ncbi:MAG: cyclase family protein [Acidimicrobiales bacterium]|nr:cyclase family protein [Acidimicrobiales bacterium]